MQKNSVLVYTCGMCASCGSEGQLEGDLCLSCGEDQAMQAAEDLKQQRLESEYCGGCMTRHNPNSPCTEEFYHDPLCMSDEAQDQRFERRQMENARAMARGEFRSF
jgi:hypothetical protein